MRLLRVGKGTWDVLVVRDERDRCQVLDFLKQLGRAGDRRRKHAERMLAILGDYIPYHGPPKAREMTKDLGDGIREFRSVAGEFRVYWFYDRDRVIVCTHAFEKDEQGDRPVEKRRAERIRLEYQRARETGELEVSGPEEEGPYEGK